MWFNAENSWKNFFVGKTKWRRYWRSKKKCPGKFFNFEVIFPGQFLTDFDDYGRFGKLHTNSTDSSRPSRNLQVKPKIWGSNPRIGQFSFFLNISWSLFRTFATIHDSYSVVWDSFIPRVVKMSIPIRRNGGGSHLNGNLAYITIRMWFFA